jgi:hypothetical protein
MFHARYEREIITLHHPAAGSVGRGLYLKSGESWTPPE